MKHQSLRTAKLLLLWLGALMVTLTLWGGQRVQADVVDSTVPTSMLSSSPDRAVASTTADSTETTVATQNEATQPPAAPAAPKAGRDISDHVSSLTVQGNKDADGMYGQGSEIRIDGAFDDSKGPIRSGDHIDLTWPTNNEITPYLVAFSGHTALTHNGVRIGDFTVTQDGGQLTFNDNVEQFMSGVHGTFFFRANLYTRSTQNGVAKLVVGPYEESLVVKGVSGSSEGELTHEQTWNGSKTGRTSPWGGKNWVNWDVRLNEQRAYLDGPIQLHDVIPDGLRIELDRLNFWIDNDEAIGLAEFKARYPQSSIQINGNEITAVFSQSEFSGRYIYFRYSTEIMDLNALNFTNSATGSYQLQGQEVQNFAYQKTVQNISFGADITGTLPGELKIFKYYPTDKGPQALAGVTFEIKNVATGETFAATTDQNGIISRQRMRPGKYEVREISAPDWIDLAKVQGQVWTVEVLEDRPGQALMIKNDKKGESIPWFDIDTQAKDRPKRDITDSIPWTDYSKNPAKVVIPWTDLTPSKKVIPWTDLTPSTKVIPWTDLTPSKKVIPWTDLTPSKKVIPWTDLTPSKKVIPWTDLTPAKPVKPVKPVLPAEQPMPWIPLEPAQPAQPDKTVKPVLPAEQPMPWIPLTPAQPGQPEKPVLPAEQPMEWLPLTPATATTTNQPNSTPHVTLTSQTPVRDTNQARLPQTGTAHESIFLGIGLVLLGFCLGLGGARWKQP